MIKNILSISLISLFFLGCSSNNLTFKEDYDKTFIKEVEKNKEETKRHYEEMPKWYLEPTPNDDYTLYGVSTGNSMESATDNALSNLLGKISIYISNEVKRTTIDDNGYYQKNVSNISKREILRTRVSNFRVTQTAKLSFDTYVVEVGVNRNQFIQAIKEEIFVLFKEYQMVLNNTNKVSQLLQINQLTKILNSNEFKNRLGLLEGISRDYTLKTDINNRIEEIKKKRYSLIEEIPFSVSSLDTLSVCKQKTEQILSDYGFIVKDNSPYKITIDSVVSKSEYEGFKIATNHLKFNIVDNGKVIDSVNINSKGGTTADFQRAIDKSCSSADYYLLIDLLKK